MWLYSHFAYYQVMLCCSFSTLWNLCSVQNCQSWWAHQNKVGHNYCKNRQYNWVINIRKRNFVLMSPGTQLVMRPICFSTMYYLRVWKTEGMSSHSIKLVFQLQCCLTTGKYIIIFAPRCLVFHCWLCWDLELPGGQRHLQFHLLRHAALHEGLHLCVCCHPPPYPWCNNCVSFFLLHLNNSTTTILPTYWIWQRINL